MHVSFTNILWYLEFGAFAVLLMAFFCWFVYIAKINYVKYNPRFDYKKRYMADGTSQASVTSPRFRNVKEAQALLPVTCAFKEALLQYTADLNLNAENATTFTGRSCGH
ncbi:unnamed protein product [Arctia plantaginis]|uniref:Uncharacterized protein n=1 Tax=Arctia plantaginis TaxID=874455 RepID=A0A8S0YYS3_ARCPL|nr:unnamed protein product [Arctia plantaginis]